MRVCQGKADTKNIVSLQYRQKGTIPYENPLNAHLKPFITRLSAMRLYPGIRWKRWPRLQAGTAAADSCSQ